jgi:pimeloyl-ACP methyl ester carboxylesterase
MSDFVQAADELTALLPNAGRVVIPDGGGFPLWEFPDLVNRELRRFLDSLAG